MKESNSSPTARFSEPTGPGPLALSARKYAWRYVGNIAFWIQRLTGIALVGYLILHVHTIHKLQDPKSFAESLKTFSTPPFKLAEIGLLATVILHALNGIRLTMVDMGVQLTRQRQWFWYFAIGAGAVLFLAGAIPMFIYGILQHS
ncbi:MAG TPA: succinate dehydrogenase, cytochrome b556 subunit [Lacipirellulaceae bacterium]|jgi:succinate dehydrogenase / fumarate reductase cytochrome b subunit|nr:succinate dehydrogenase, cytochrome b556 subunit [Lacipirellulaceae bacterium]